MRKKVNDVFNILLGTRSIKRRRFHVRFQVPNLMVNMSRNHSYISLLLRDLLLTFNFISLTLSRKCFVFISNEHKILALRFLMISRERMGRSKFLYRRKKGKFLKWNFVCKQHLEMKWRWCVMNRMHDVGVNHTLDWTLKLRSTYDFNLTFKQSCIFDCLFSYQFIRFDKVFCFVCGCLFWHIKLCRICLCVSEKKADILTHQTVIESSLVRTVQSFNVCLLSFCMSGIGECSFCPEFLIREHEVWGRWKGRKILSLKFHAIELIKSKML